MDCCSATGQQFDAAVAKRDLRRWRRRGPDASTKHLIKAVRAGHLPPQPTLVDVGGGVGAIHHTLLDQGFAHATHVDASAAYLGAAAEEAERRGHTARVQFQHGDFSVIAATVPSADVVTLDRVVCCYPDYAGLLRAAADHTRRFLAFSYPRRHWFSRLVVAGTNAVSRLRGRAFRAYVHSPAAMAAVLEGAGLRRSWSGGTWIWAVELFERAPMRAPPQST